MELLPLKATFTPGEPIAFALAGAVEATMTVFHLDRVVAEAQVRPAQTLLELDPLPVGGYGVEVRTGDDVARSAFDVLADPLARPRYGFVSRYERGRDVNAVAANARRLHLNAIQFYDWMYRHASLLPPADEFEDPLGRPLSMQTVRALAAALRDAGSLPFGYAAVYAVGRDEWPEWRRDGLYRADGRPWTLGDDFLWIVDPSSERWLRHFTAELARAGKSCGFAGFHLDQYGDPKRAVRADGTTVDLADAFPKLIAAARGALPGTRLIFNNVNNFPTWATAAAPQDALYIEVWPPHTRLDHLSRLIGDARAAARDKPVVLAAYMSVFREADEPEAMAAARLTMATIFSHGASHLLAGEDGAVLTDPYYVRHHEAPPATRSMLRDWYDFVVRYGDLLYDGTAIDVTTAIAGGVNKDLVVEADAPTSVHATPGMIWVRAVETRHGLVVHLIDLSAERDLDWDAPKVGGAAMSGTRVCVRRISREPAAHVASPEAGPALTAPTHVARGDYDVFELPNWRSWAVVRLRL